MTILIAYLAIGLIVALAGIPQGFLNPANKPWQNVTGVVFAAALWPFAGYLMVRWLIKNNEGPRCAWCGDTSAITPDEIRAHILICEQHPMREEMERLTRENGQLSEYLSNSIGDACKSREEGRRLFDALAWISHNADTAQQMRDRAIRMCVEYEQKFARPADPAPVEPIAHHPV